MNTFCCHCRKPVSADVESFRRHARANPETHAGYLTAIADPRMQVTTKPGPDTLRLYSPASLHGLLGEGHFMTQPKFGREHA